jgi:sugar phosphate isomerase/epimerase
MMLGGQVTSLDDIDFLERSGFQVGEIALTSEQARDFWLRSGVKSPRDSGIFLIAHGPVEGPPNDLENLRTNVKPALEDTIVTAEAMAIRFLTIHLWTDPRFVHQKVIDHKIAVLRDITAFAADLGVKVGIENLSENADDLGRLLAGAPLLGITLDVGHGQLLTKTNTALGIIEKLSASIGHVHLHDNHGGAGAQDDLHLPIGEGIIDFPCILDALLRKGYAGTATLELKPRFLIESRARLLEIAREVLLKQAVG